MPARKKIPIAKPPRKGTNPSISDDLNDQIESVIAALRSVATKHTLDGMAQYAIPSDKAFGVSMGDIQKLAKRLQKERGRRDHELAAALWETGWYEARMLTAFVDDPARVTAAQMDRWCRDFDSWAICDTLCMHLFDRTPHAFGKIAKWSRGREEFVKRAAFALLASLALHDKKSSNEPFFDCLPLIEVAATDDRNFVKKGVNWALRAVGERNLVLNAAAKGLAQRLAASPQATPRWVGKDALRQLTRPATLKRLAARDRAAEQ